MSTQRLQYSDPDVSIAAEAALKDEVKEAAVSTQNVEPDNKNANTYRKLLEKSEDSYNETVKNIVNISNDNLNALRTDKISLREKFVSFFQYMLVIQTIFLFIIILAKALLVVDIPDNVLITFMTSVFVETIGCLIMMISFAFKSDEELKIIETLNAVVKTFQKFKDEKSEDTKKDS